MLLHFHSPCTMYNVQCTCNRKAYSNECENKWACGSVSAGISQRLRLPRASRSQYSVIWVPPTQRPPQRKDWQISWGEANWLLIKFCNMFTFQRSAAMTTEGGQKRWPVEKELWPDLGGAIYYVSDLPPPWMRADPSPLHLHLQVAPSSSDEFCQVLLNHSNLLQRSTLSVYGCGALKVICASVETLARG